MAISIKITDETIRLEPLQQAKTKQTKPLDSQACLHFFFKYMPLGKLAQRAYNMRLHKASGV